MSGTWKVLLSKRNQKMITLEFLSFVHSFVVGKGGGGGGHR